eukprot:TRINITY_DN18578_c0_g1_i5.p1 TRINITY_DN18578_c0_g1~~TRINITY_DN18578_c0_g1_i5.p1  ORF type:complete len:1223 (+),score=420.95 TRINITY_DN18578_c0_g1_i5:409-4077(+)
MHAQHPQPQYQQQLQQAQQLQLQQQPPTSGQPPPQLAQQAAVSQQPVYQQPTPQSQQQQQQQQFYQQVQQVPNGQQQPHLSQQLHQQQQPPQQQQQPHQQQQMQPAIQPTQHLPVQQQQQPIQQPSQQCQPKAVGTPVLTVTGCLNQTVANIIRGNYGLHAENHGKPVYKKDGESPTGMEVLIYFWDHRDGANFHGWWFGPKVGGDQVWAYCPNGQASTPPATQWKVPYDGAIDSTFLVSPYSGGAPLPQQAALGQFQPQPPQQPVQQPPQQPVPQQPVPQQPVPQQPPAQSYQHFQEQQHQPQQQQQLQQQQQHQYGQQQQQFQQQGQQKQLQGQQGQLQSSTTQQQSGEVQQHQQQWGQQPQQQNWEQQSKQPPHQEKQQGDYNDNYEAWGQQPEAQQSEHRGNTNGSWWQDQESTNSRSSSNSRWQQDSNDDWRKQKQEAEQRQRLLRQQEDQRREEDRARRKAEDDRRRREEDEARRQREEEHRRKVAERARLAEERRAAEEERRRAEEERRRLEEEKLRVEQAKVTMLRQAIQKVRNAEEADFERLKSEMDTLLSAELRHCGPQQARVEEDAKDAVKQVREKIDAAVKSREEEAQRKKAQEEMTQRLFKDLADGLASAEAAIQKLRSVANAVSGPAAPAATVQDVQKAADDVAKARLIATTACRDVVKVLITRRTDVDEVRWASMENKTQLVEFQTRIHKTHVDVHKVGKDVDQSVEKVLRRDKALQSLAAREEVIKKYDQDKDGFLSRSEIVAYALGELKYEVPGAVLDSVLARLGDATCGHVPGSRFVDLRKALGIAREEAASKERREAAARKTKEAEERWAAVEDRLRTASLAFGPECEKAVETAEAAAEAAAKEPKDLPVAQVAAVASGLREANTAAQVLLTAARRQLDDAADIRDDELRRRASEGISGADVAVDAVGRDEALRKKARAFGERLEKVSATASRLEERAKKLQREEQDEFRGQATTVLRAAAAAAELKGGDALFEAVDKDADGAISKADFVAFCESHKERAEGLDATKLGRIFDCIVDSKIGTLSKLELVRLVSICYRVSRQTPMAEGLVIKESKTIRKLEPGEIFDCDMMPEKEEAAGVMRVRGRAIKDGKVGYATIKGNQGAVILEQDGDILEVASSTELTDRYELEGGQVLRKLVVGDFVQVLEWERKPEGSDTGRTHVKVWRSKELGNVPVVGWVTSTVADGSACLRPASREAPKLSNEA